MASGGRTPPEAVIWDVSEGRAQLTLPVPGNYCSGVDWSRDGRSFALASSKELRVYQLGGVEGGGGGVQHILCHALLAACGFFAGKLRGGVVTESVG